MKRLVYISILVILTVSAYSQNYQKKQSPELNQHALKVWTKSSQPSRQFIEFKKNTRITDDQQLRDVLALPEAADVSKVRVFKDQKGVSHAKYQLSYQGIPIEGARLVLHTERDQLISAHGDFYSAPALNLHPRLSAAKALSLAREYIAAEIFYVDGEGVDLQAPELVILPMNEVMYLAYRLDIYAQKPFSRHFVYVSAHSGEILKMVSRIHDLHASGEAVTRYQGLQTIETESGDAGYTLNDYSRGVHIATLDMNSSVNYLDALDFSDLDNYWDVTTNQDDAATNAHYAVQQTYDYYKQVFNRNSFDDAGAAITSYIHFGDNYYNAFWNGNSFVYGDGDGLSTTALTPLDVVAHEYTHAVTQYSAALEYADESGALNESFSDIFAVAIDFHLNSSQANYLLGEQFSVDGTPSRSMTNPKLYGHPDTYKGEYWHTSVTDNGGVHTNNGVQNHWFYLLAEGGTGTNDLGNNYEIDGIGIEKAAEIAYRNLTVYLTPYSDYEDARFYSIQAAVDLFGACSPEVTAVTNAWYAVGVGNVFSGEVKADFWTSANFSTEGSAEIGFYNSSSNATAYTWLFGDGSSSNEMSPSHTYSSEGLYSVKLIAIGESACAGADTLIREDMIRVGATDILPAPLCVPESQNTDHVGIAGLSFKNIEFHSDLSEQEGPWVDRTESHSAELIAGEQLNFSVVTGPKSRERVSLWLDLDNDGQFILEEKIWESENLLGEHLGSLIVPEPTSYDQAIRMRLISDNDEDEKITACGMLSSGQAEDYRIVITSEAQSPVAAYAVDHPVIGVGEMLNVRDFSQFLPQSWQWEFPGAEPATSVQQSPWISYSEQGTYNLSLQVGNALGTDSLYVHDFIEVLPVSIMGTETFSDEASGLLYDSGDKTASYQNDENSSFLIQPTCANSLEICFLSLGLEAETDFLYVYDGTDAQAELLLKASGNELPESISAQSGAAYIVFESNMMNTADGFVMKWEAKFPPRVPVVADFAVSDSMPALLENAVFADASTNSPVTWHWDFGDGSTSTEMQPKHYFETPGVKNISLWVSNCFYEDSIIKTITVLPSPEIQLNTDTIKLSLTSGMEGSFELEISNMDSEGILNSDFFIREAEEMISIQKSEVTGTDESVEKHNDTLSYASLEEQNMVSFRQEQSFAANTFSYSQLSLNDVLDAFLAKSDQLLSVVPDVFQFSDGLEGVSIVDGGNDMYDGGNYISTSYASNIAYSQNKISQSTAFGSQGAYLTSKQAGIFLLAADIDQLDKLSLAGNLGADGKGKVDAAIIRIGDELQSYTGFVKRVYGTDDPSVNHLIIVPNAGQNVMHSVDANTNSDGHELRNLQDANRAYYLLFASEEGGYVNDSVMAELMSRFIELIEPGCSWLSPQTESMRLAAQSSAKLQLLADAKGLLPGTYTANLHVLSNDLQNEELVVPVSMEVVEGGQIEYKHDAFLGKTHLGSSLVDTSYLVNRGAGILSIDGISVEGDRFDAILEKKLVQPGDSVQLMLIYQPLKIGEDSAVITIQSNSKSNQQLQQIVRAIAVYPVPELIQVPEDRTLYLGDVPEEIDLSTMFRDNQGNKLDFDVHCIDNQSINHYIFQGNLLIDPVMAGTVQIEIQATNIWGESNTVEFSVTVLNYSALEEATHDELKIFPNPASNLVSLSGFSAGSNEVRVSIADMAGHTLQVGQYSSVENDSFLQIDISSLPTGIYHLIVEGAASREVLRLIKE